MTEIPIVFRVVFEADRVTPSEVEGSQQSRPDCQT
jgi:hypothetical protein